MLHNTGQSLVFRVDKETKQHVNISGGPLGSFSLKFLCIIDLYLPSIAAYRYQFEEIYIHYGTENNQGSEHQIHGYSFPGEVSLNRLLNIHNASPRLKLFPDSAFVAGNLQENLDICSRMPIISLKVIRLLN